MFQTESWLIRLYDLLNSGDLSFYGESPLKKFTGDSIWLYSHLLKIIPAVYLFDFGELALKSSQTSI
jgi:hypothetical protein